VACPRGIRPTQGFVRRSLFSRLGDGIRGTRMLELFAGSGAVGIEALCRGAEFAVFVDSSREAAEAIRKNLDRAGASDQARIMTRDVSAGIRQLARSGNAFDWCFADPPYGTPDLAAKLESLSLVIAEAGLFILEQSNLDRVPDLPGFAIEKQARLRDVRLGFYRRLLG